MINCKYIFKKYANRRITKTVANVKNKTEDSYTLVIKNILIRRKESDTYLATVSRHCWSLWIMMKKDEIL